MIKLNGLGSFLGKYARPFGYAVLIGLVVLGMMLALIALVQIYGNFPPITIKSLDAETHPPVCSGEEYDFHSEVTIEDGTLLFFYLSVMDESGSFNINGAQSTLPPRPHPRASQFEQTLPWVVPELPPGNYRRVLTIRGPDGNEKPVFIETHFTVKPKDKCPTLEEVSLGAVEEPE